MNGTLLTNQNIRIILVRINELADAAFLINIERAAETKALAFFGAKVDNDIQEGLLDVNENFPGFILSIFFVKDFAFPFPVKVGDRDKPSAKYPPLPGPGHE